MLYRRPSLGARTMPPGPPAHHSTNRTNAYHDDTMKASLDIAAVAPCDAGACHSKRIGGEP